jgi:FMN reductase
LTRSGLVKNALDYIEDLRDEPWPYLGSVGHALRAWPTPLGLAVNTAEPVWDASGEPADDLAARVEALAAQLLSFSERSLAHALESGLNYRLGR